jgi:hypothetical protein
MSLKTLMDVRAALATGTNTTGVLGSGAGGAEIQKKIEELPVEAFNKVTDLRPLIRSVNINQLAFIWNLVTESSSGSGVTNTSFDFYAQTATATPQPSSKVQLVAVAKAYRADYEVSNLMIAAGMGNQLTEEASYAAEALAIGEEKQIIIGANTTAGGKTTNAFNGLYGTIDSATYGGLMLNGVATNALNGLGDTSTLYGTARSTTQTNLNAGAVDVTGNAGGGSRAALDLSHMDSAITISNKRGAKQARRVFLMSEERVDAVSQLLQAQQRFMSTGNTVEFDGGFRVLAYRRIPIIGSRFMDNCGIVKASAGSITTPGNTDASAFLLDLDNLFMAYVAGVNATHTPVVGGGTTTPTNRPDLQGGYYKSYGVLVMKRFDTQVAIFNLTDV